MNLPQILKSVIGALLAGLTSAGTALAATQGHLHAGEYVAIAIAVLTTFGGVWSVPNAPDPSTPVPVPQVVKDVLNDHAKVLNTHADALAALKAQPPSDGNPSHALAPMGVNPDIPTEPVADAQVLASVPPTANV